MSTKSSAPVALSLKQPWAALVVAGVKTMEIRRWPTARRGRILIHAARVPDKRPEAWKHVPAELAELAQLAGGIIGAVELTGCVHYHDLDTFQRDQALHCNEPGWFEKTGLFGFVLARSEPLPFRKFPGWFRFFPVPETGR